MAFHVSGSKKTYAPAVFAAAFVLAAAAGCSCVAAEGISPAGDGQALTRSGHAVGAGYVAPGFVDDGPPTGVADAAPRAASVPVPEILVREAAETEARNAARAASRYLPRSMPVQVAQAGIPTAGAHTGPDTARQLAELLAQASDADINDPLESFNRVMFDINYFLERLILRPVAELYVLMLPDEARTAIRSFLRNLRTPVVLANDLMQGEGDRAWDTTRRFLINSTVGVGGLIDVANKMGIPHHDEDLGQTFAVWGVDEPFYLVLPIFGPSNPRDAVGKFADSFLDPVWWWAENTDREGITWGRNVVTGIDSYSQVMEELDNLRKTSIDYYAAVRSIFRQKRAADIRNGQAQDAPLPDIRYDFNADLSLN